MPAQAKIWHTHEAPDQVVYQSRQALKDQHRNSWQAIAFNRVRADGSHGFKLRLVGFPGITSIDRDRPLVITTSLGKSFSVADNSSQIFTDATAPEPNIAQYDLMPIVPKLQAAIPIKLQLPTLGDEDIRLSIPPALIDEWQTIAARGDES
ncbi:DUF3122 domain-containing protein [Thalassoporum mexicanum]|uniref:DUF3122 domain-containing protein n=1 Tax=Thalassoporum mexicanum TaxID=3457544 RepID=UPI00031B319A|nr:DUF3122 domain-containing protein [Pseudanabaena sp. PCC 7367]